MPLRRKDGAQGDVKKWWDTDRGGPDGPEPNWVSYYWKYINSASFPNVEINEFATQGPLVKKVLSSSLNILMTYKSFWQWGGEWAQPVQVCDPRGSNPGYAMPIADPRGYTRPQDYDGDGLLTRKALKRLVSGSPKRDQPAFSAFQSDTDATGSETTSLESGSQGTDDEDQYPEEAEETRKSKGAKMVRHRREHGRRAALDLLRRLLLKSSFKSYK